MHCWSYNSGFLPGHFQAPPQLKGEDPCTACVKAEDESGFSSNPPTSTDLMRHPHLSDGTVPHQLLPWLCPSFRKDRKLLAELTPRQ